MKRIHMRTALLSVTQITDIMVLYRSVRQFEILTIYRAVKVLTDITPTRGFEYLQKLGFSSLNAETDALQPLALGGITNG